MKNSNSLSAEVYINTYNIEKAISNVFNYTTREELSFDVQDTFDAIMAEVYEMRRTLKPMMSEENKIKVDELVRSRK